ncbi:MAG TPA: amidohydrolase family protein [Gaiellaceae bacterium]|nr:amidohydrolase family protein [Gaiellaceae bacterium]
MSTVVDVHAHVVVPGLGAEVEWRAGAQVVSYRGQEIRSALREFCDVGRILEEQDRAGVDVVVLCPWVNLCGVEVERQNEALAALVGERVLALGTIDPRRPEGLVELMRDGRLRGVEIPAVWNGTYLGDPHLREFWAAAEETGAFVFVHPTSRGFALPVMEEHYLWNTVGNPLETTVSATHLLGAGVLDDHPRLRVLLAHGGGVLPSLRGRLAREQEIHPPGRDVRTALRLFLVDTVVHDVDVLRDLVGLFGPERVLLGSDYPFDMGTERPAEVVRALGLPPDEEALILGGNALRLLAQEARA